MKMLLLRGLIIMIWTIGVAAGDVCDTMWHHRPGRDSCYQVFDNESLHFKSSVSSCHQRQSTLIYIDDATDAKFLLQIMHDTNFTGVFWVNSSLDMLDANESSLRWNFPDGGNISDEMDFSNASESNSFYESKCAAITYLGYIRFYDCSNTHHFICEKSVLILATQIPIKTSELPAWPDDEVSTSQAETSPWPAEPSTNGERTTIEIKTSPVDKGTNEENRLIIYGGLKLGTWCVIAGGSLIFVVIVVDLCIMRSAFRRRRKRRGDKSYVSISVKRKSLKSSLILIKGFTSMGLHSESNMSLNPFDEQDI